jgi:histidinol phosphatase-like PHP family hydrolase
LENKTKMPKIVGIGEGIGKKISELLLTGSLKYYEELRRSEYAPLTEFLKIRGMGPKHAKLVYDELGISTVEALKKAAEKGKLRQLPGLGEKAEENILKGIEQTVKYKERLPLAFVYPRAQDILEELKKINQVKHLLLAGSLRRMKETIADADILAASDDPDKVMTHFAKLPQTQKDMTNRIIRAIENPNVDVIAHPTGRLIGKREPYEVDMDKIMDACKANKKILELNACPERLDLSDMNCRKAKEKGIKIVISTDAHRDVHLNWMKFGVATARRGWIEPQDVINSLSLSELMKFLGR